MKAGREKVKNFGLRIRTWLSNSNNVALVALIVAIVSLMYTGVQAGLAKSALEVSRADLEAMTFPHFIGQPQLESSPRFQCTPWA